MADKQYIASYLRPTDSNLQNKVTFQLVVNDDMKAAKLIMRDYLRDFSAEILDVRPPIVNEYEIPIEIASLLVSSGALKEPHPLHLWLEPQGEYRDINGA